MKIHPLFPVLAALALAASSACAQWVEESYPLEAGWNAIWLSHDPSQSSDPERTRGVEEVLQNYLQIVEVWRWNPLGSTVQFTQSPNERIQSDTDWAVWRRGDPGQSTLGTMTGNAAYLVSVAPGASPFTLKLTGRPLVPSYKFSSSGLNFLGFPTTGARTFNEYFTNDAVLADEPQIFRYVGGALSDVAPKNPVELLTPNTSKIARGQAYWVRGDSYTEYYGPLKVTVLSSGGIDFGRKLNTVTVRVKNVTDPSKNKTVDATFDLVASEPPPGGGAAAPPVPLRVRGPRDANLQFTYTDLPATVTLAPGEERELVLDAHRSQLTVNGQSYESILTVTDDLGHSRIDLPVSATGSSPEGLWVGAAVLDSVNRVETIRGPEFDAPPETPDGEGPETREIVTTTETTSGGQTTTVQTFNLSFDDNGDALLPGGGFPLDGITVSGPDGSPVYVPGTDYNVIASQRATVTSPGSGYTLPPDVVFKGGGGSGASAQAILSASVGSVRITDGGSGYDVDSPPSVEFSGGGGSGARGVVELGEDQNPAAAPGSHIVTGVRLTNRGSGYSSAPTILFTGENGIGAEAEATITGGVGSVVITQGGSSYTVPPSVTITAKADTAGETSGDGAEVSVEVRNGEVAGVDLVRKEQGGQIGESARAVLTTYAVAAPGVRDGTVVSNVISTSKLVTLNVKSHLLTRRVSTGGGAAAPSLFPVRLILHASESGAPTLVQQVYLGQRDGQVYAGSDESTIAAIVKSPGETPPGEMSRVSSASFPRGDWWPGTGTFGSSANFSIVLGHNAPSNPFVHTYHPDHDNWDARYETPLPAGVESYAVTREITLTFDEALPPGVSDLGWGVTTLGGTYTEVIRGLRSEEIATSGRFLLHQVAEVPTLTQP